MDVPTDVCRPTDAVDLVFSPARLISPSTSTPLRLLPPPPPSLPLPSAIMPSPFFASAFPLYSVVEKVELKGQQVAEKVAEVAGAKPTGEPVVLPSLPRYPC